MGEIGEDIVLRGLHLGLMLGVGGPNFARLEEERLGFPVYEQNSRRYQSRYLAFIDTLAGSHRRYN